MKVLSVRLARALAFVDIQDLIPRGHIFYPAIVRAIIERFHFQKFPNSPEEFEQEKGINFVDGIFDGIAIDKFTIWPRVLVVETRADTDVSKRFIEELLRWGKDNFELTYEPDMISWAYVSGIVFRCEFDLLAASNPVFARIASKVGNAVSDIWGERIEYRPTTLTAGHDPLSRKLQIATFYIQYQQETHFSDSRFLSESPLPTSQHLELLEEFEAEVKTFSAQMANSST